ncbi:unnamed protein product [Closterium sp. NIES-65]|nr:unnamed protein product [Closterium sp. NIES-65]
MCSVNHLYTHTTLMNANGIVALPVAAPPGKWLGAGGANIVDGEKQYIGVVSMAWQCMWSGEHGGERVREGAMTAALKAGVVSLIGNLPEGLSLWVASTSTPLMQHAGGVRAVAVVAGSAEEERMEESEGSGGAGGSADVAGG